VGLVEVLDQRQHFLLLKMRVVIAEKFVRQMKNTFVKC
jgi:hypothetical protein